MSSCERLTTEADGRILLGTGTNRTNWCWLGGVCVSVGMRVRKKVCPLQTKKKKKRDACGLLLSARGFDKSHREKEKKEKRQETRE